MVPLSKQLAGTVIPDDTYGTQLGSNGKTIDPIKEFQNFKKAGEVLSNIWSETTTDDFMVTATPIDPLDNAINFKSLNGVILGAKCLESHVHISKNLSEIKKM